MSKDTMPNEETPTIARANLGSRRQDGRADGVLGALEDLGRNRLPLPQTVRVHNAKKAVKEQIQEREELRKALIEQYDESGEGWQDPNDAPEELLEKVGELMGEIVELDLGDPVKLNGEAMDVDISETSYAILDALDFLEITD